MHLLVCLALIMGSIQFEMPVQDTVSRKLIEVNGKCYTDTAWSSAFNPDSIHIYYYNVRSKYPESSESICSKAVSFLKGTRISTDSSGYITYRFFIDSAGLMQKMVQVLQVSERYTDCRFKDDLVWVLFDYLKTLTKWKPARAPAGYPPFYIGTMTFKIHEGNIVAVIP